MPSEALHQFFPVGETNSDQSVATYVGAGAPGRADALPVPVEPVPVGAPVAPGVDACAPVPEGAVGVAVPVADGEAPAVEWAAPEVADAEAADPADDEPPDDDVAAEAPGAEVLWDADALLDMEVDDATVGSDDVDESLPHAASASVRVHAPVRAAIRVRIVLFSLLPGAASDVRFQACQNEGARDVRAGGASSPKRMPLVGWGRRRPRLFSEVPAAQRIRRDR